MSLIHNLFFEHPEENKMTYMQHFFFSTSLGLYFIGCSCKAFIHAFIPSLFITSSSDVPKELNNLFDIMHRD
jgi:hypothetical protein